MDEDCFEFALEEVQGYHPEGEGLEGRGSGEGGVGGEFADGEGVRVAVDVGSQVVEGWVDEEGAEVFDYEDCAPGDLGAY